ncbi:MAG: mechanosensitive ion channel family protein [Saprospiraceae bacterium]
MNDNLYKLLFSVGFALVVLFLRWVADKWLIPKFQDPKTRYNWRKGLTYIVYVIISLALITIWIKEFQSAATFLGLLSAGLAVALKDPIVNFFGWLFIIFNRPFEVSDRIEIGEIKGDVLDINFFKFTLLEIGAWVDANQSTGRVIHVPNGKVFTTPTINFVQGFRQIWVEMPVLITFQSNWEKAKALLLDIETKRVKPLEELAKKEMDLNEKRFNIHYNNLSPTVYTSVKTYGIMLTLRFLNDPRSQRNSEQMIWEAVLKEFALHDDIQFAYPSQSIYLPGKEENL